MKEDDRVLCKKCGALSSIDAEVCWRCRAPLQSAPTSESQEQYANSYGEGPDLEEFPRNAVDEFMHLGFVKLLGFGIRFGIVLAIAEIIALLIIVIILILLALVLTTLGVGVPNLLGNYTILSR